MKFILDDQACLMTLTTILGWDALLDDELVDNMIVNLYVL